MTAQTKLTISAAILNGVAADRKAHAVKGADPRALDLDKRKAFAYGNQAGDNLEYWSGLKPPTTATVEELGEYKRRVVIMDVLTGCLSTYTSHILGDDPDWTATRPDAEQELDAQSEEVKALALWHQDAGLHGKLKKADYDMRWGEVSYLRMFTPDVLQELAPQLLTRSPRELRQALRLAYLQELDATQAGCYRDGAGVELAYWYAYSQVENGQTLNLVEIHTRQAVGVYVDQGGELVPKNLGEGRENPYPNPVADPDDPLTFHCLMHELRRGEGAQIALSDIDLQNSTSVAASNIRKNNDLAGHRQYYTVNAAMPQDDEGKPIPYRFGAQRVLDIQAAYVLGTNGEPVVDDKGKPVLSAAHVGTFDPVDSKGMREDAAFYKGEVYSRFDMLWKLNEGQVSGESKRESRSAFDRSLPDEAVPAGRALEWAIGTAYRYAQYIQNNDAPESLNIKARLYLRVAPVDLETWKSALQAEKDGQLDLLTLGEMNPYGVEATTYVERVLAARASNPTLANLSRTAGLPEPVYLRMLKEAGLPVLPADLARADALADLGLEGAEAGAGLADAENAQDQEGANGQV